MKNRFAILTGLVAGLLLPRSVHADGGEGGFVLLVLGAIVAVWAFSCLVSLIGIIRGWRRYRKGKRSLPAIMLALIFLVPNGLSALIFLKPQGTNDHWDNIQILAFVAVILSFLWLGMAIWAVIGKKNQSSK